MVLGFDVDGLLGCRWFWLVGIVVWGWLLMFLGLVVDGLVLVVNSLVLVVDSMVLVVDGLDWLLMVWFGC
jgi:hypothetical protein